MPTRYRWLRILSMLVVLVFIGVLGLGFWIVGSPAQARRRALDRERIDDLGSLRRLLDEYGEVKHSAPADLAELQAADFGKDYQTDLNDCLTDPVSHRPYEYRRIDANKIELCAIFDENSPPDVDRYSFDPSERPFLSHRKGRECFTLTVRTRRAP